MGGAILKEYEIWSLVLTGIYDLLTLGLLCFVVYEAVIKPKLSNVALFIQTLPKDTDVWGYEGQPVDFILENKGVALQNISITSEPDYIGWNQLGYEAKLDDKKGQGTSKYFKRPLPYLGVNERKQFFWCDAVGNKDVLEKPFSIFLSYDNPTPIIKWFKKRIVQEFPFDFSVFDGVYWGVTTKYDTHNVAKELARIRINLNDINQNIADNLAQQ